MWTQQKQKEEQAICILDLTLDTWGRNANGLCGELKLFRASKTFGLRYYSAQNTYGI